MGKRVFFLYSVCLSVDSVLLLPLLYVLKTKKRTVGPNCTYFYVDIHYTLVYDVDNITI